MTPQDIGRRRSTRRALLRQAGVGLTAFAVSSRTTTARSQGTYVTAESLGITTTNSAATNRTNLIAALNNTNRWVRFSMGSYPIDNTATPTYLTINNFGGRLLFENASKWVFTRNNTRGIIFAGGTGAQYYGLRTAFTTLPPTRVDAQECVLFDGTTDTYVQDGNILGSAAAGLLCWNCIRPKVLRLTVKQTCADGLHFANCQDARVDYLWTEDTGDDGLAFLNYASAPDRSGGIANNIDVRRSKARGITVVGQRNVAVSTFAIADTATSGLYVAHEGSFNTRVPRDCTFSGGQIDRPGQYTGQSGNRYGVNFEDVDGTIQFSGITVNNAYGRGVSGTMRSTATVIYEGGTVYLPGDSGFDIQGGGGTVRLLGPTVDGSPSYGFYVAGAGSLESTTFLTAHNCAGSNPLHRAITFENNARVNLAHLYVQDDRNPARGYVVGAFGSQSGTLGTIHDKVQNGPVVIDDPSGLAYTVVVEA